MYQRILIPLDGSEVAEVALPHAITMANTFNADLNLLCVALAHGFPGSDPVETQRVAVAESHAYLEQLCTRLQQQGLRVTPTVRYGNAAEEIIAYAGGHDISIIVMATHGRSGVGRWLLGSTAEKVLRGTPVPILLIRATPRQEAA
jgi:nucleotide-binding universal stress UspA family protein